MDESEVLRRVLAREEIVALSYAYAEALDTRRFDDLREILAETVRADYGGYTCDGIDAFLEMVVSHLGGCGPSQHLFSNHRVEVDNDRAGMRFYAAIMHAGSGEQSDRFFNVWSEYSVELQRRDQHWVVTRMDQRPIKFEGDMSILKPA